MVEPSADAVPDYAAMLRLDGRVFVMLGAGSGIGRQCAHALAAVGATVVCVDLDGDRAAAVAAEVGGVVRRADVTVRSEVAEVFGFVRRDLGRLDGVVDIIGLARYKPLVELTDADWQFHHEAVLRHAYLAIQYATGVWQATATGGAMTFVASVAGIASSPMLGAYGVEKAGLMSLVRTAAVELGPHGIRVNAVAPGIVRTPRAQANEKWTRELLNTNIARTPLRKLGYPSDVAAALLFLSSPMAGHITGQALVVDGGNSVGFNVVSPSP
jgi:NAD(P)-dependent dehydrogenase (short-subunit alcohol dehydrogenase family)